MTKIAIITDTDSSIPAEIAASLDIVQVPITIHFGESGYTTGLDIDDARLFEIIDRTKKLPTTAAPPPAAFEIAFREAFRQGYQSAICVCVSSVVSGTYQAAVSARNQLPDKDITVIDSRQISLAQGLIVIHAARAAKAGKTKSEILAIIDNMKDRVHVYGVLPTLKYLAMSGRVGKLAATLADSLDIKPILSVQNGKLELLEKTRTMKKAMQRLIELALTSVENKSIEEIAFFHAVNLSGANGLQERLKDVLNYNQKSIMAEFTPGLSVHTGAGVIGYVILTAE
jgi:DegV family protein with EDD domain